MNLTEFFRLRKPEGSDPVNIKDLNDNFDVIDTELNKRPSSTGAASDMTVNFTQAESRANLKTGEKLSTAMGKIAKWYEDLKSVAWSGRYTDLSERPTLGGAAAMGVADNDTTNNANFLPTARVVYEHGKEIDALNSEMQLRLPEHLAFGMDA
ncbi:MAG: hypothetical protein Q4C73_09490, partial [Eubacteriales bacterium]|nr:hypothetical protein [Eubacteriales bacterium]